MYFAKRSKHTKKHFHASQYLVDTLMSDRRHLLPSGALLRTVRATFTAYVQPGWTLHYATFCCSKLTGLRYTRALCLLVRLSSTSMYSKIVVSSHNRLILDNLLSITDYLRCPSKSQVGICTLLTKAFLFFKR